jgi:hypothetical protein
MPLCTTFLHSTYETIIMPHRMDPFTTTTASIENEDDDFEKKNNAE